MVADPDVIRARLEAAGALRGFHGLMSDVRYDKDGELFARDEVLRLRVFQDKQGTGETLLGWKGATRITADGYKTRPELEYTITPRTGPPEELLHALGYRRIHAIDRYVEYYHLGTADLRLEWYPRMDVLIEVEGDAQGIEAGLVAVGLPRADFSAESLTSFAARYAERTGLPAILSAADLEGELPFLDHPMIIPELGPLFGTLVEPADPGTANGELDVVRMLMVSALFERVGEARRLLASGDESGARTAFGSRVWVQVWDDAAERSAAVLTERIERQIRQSAAYSRYPRKRLTRQLPSTEDRRGLAARLSAAGIGLESAAPALEFRGAEWQEAQRRMAGELEQAWHRLVRTAHDELAFWESRSSAIRAWRRPWWPLLLGGSAAIALSTWIGLMLGGYLPVPSPLRPAADWFWGLPWP